MLNLCCFLFNTSKLGQRLWTCHHTSPRGFMVWELYHISCTNFLSREQMALKQLFRKTCNILAPILYTDFFFQNKKYWLQDKDWNVFFFNPGLVISPSPIGPPGIRRAMCISVFLPMRACHFLKFSSLKFYSFSFLVFGNLLLLSLVLLRECII